MKKLIIAFVALLLLCNHSHAQTNDKSAIGLGVGMGVIGTGFITGFFIASNNGYNTWKNHDGETITAAHKAQVRRDNLPYLITGAGCYLISIVSFCNAANVEIHFKKHKNVTASIRGAGFGFCYTMR